MRFEFPKRGILLRFLVLCSVTAFTALSFEPSTLSIERVFDANRDTREFVLRCSSQLADDRFVNQCTDTVYTGNLVLCVFAVFLLVSLWVQFLFYGARLAVMSGRFAACPWKRDWKVCYPYPVAAMQHRWVALFTIVTWFALFVPALRMEGELHAYPLLASSLGVVLSIYDWITKRSARSDKTLFSLAALLCGINTEPDDEEANDPFRVTMTCPLCKCECTAQNALVRWGDGILIYHQPCLGRYIEKELTVGGTTIFAPHLIQSTMTSRTNDLLRIPFLP